MVKRRKLILYDYKNRPTEVKLSKEHFWWGQRIGERMGTLHCVISCYNEASVVYITDFGFARIAYCDSHAIMRITHTLITGQLERGIWCVAENGKLKPHWYYKRYFSYMKKLHPKQARKLKEKLSKFGLKKL